MKFFNKLKPITLNFYTNHLAAYELAQPKAASSFLPDWWKNLPTQKVVLDIDALQERKYLNMRSCPGMKHMYQRGCIIPLWSDIAVEISEVGTDSYRWQSSDAAFGVEPHHPDQFNHHWDVENYQHIKLILPWQIQCDEPEPFLYIDCCWNRNTQNRYSVLSGILEFKHQHTGNINMIFSKMPEKYTLLLKHLTPMFQLIPLSNRPLRIKTHFVEEEKIKNFRVLGEHRPTFMDAYKTVVQTLRKENK